MAASNFANIIIDKLANSIGTNGSYFNYSTPSIANSAIAEGVTEYLLSNTTISVSYAGTTTTTPPSPYVTTDSCGITGACAPPIGTDFNTWVRSLESNIVAGFFISSGVSVVPVTPPPAFISGLIIFQSTIRQVHLNNLWNPQLAVWEAICQSILDWLNGIVSLPYPATTTVPPSAGTSTITKITVL